MKLDEALEETITGMCIHLARMFRVLKVIQDVLGRNRIRAFGAVISVEDVNQQLFRALIETLPTLGRIEKVHHLLL